MLLRQSGPSLAVHTPAKLNLFLEILGKRPDGYHELETLMVSIGWYDTLRFADAGDDQIDLRVRIAGTWRSESAEAIPTGADNLIVRAARLLQEATRSCRGARIDVWKRIPPASGLAGGSSDAAATLAGLNRLWSLGLTRAALIELGARLGSDVPFFLAGNTAAVCRGRGERLEPLRLPNDTWFVIGRPATGLSTAEVYRHCRPSPIPRSVSVLIESLRRGRLAHAASAFHNALEAPAVRLNVDVATLSNWFDNQSVVAHQMSGSGSACFAVCRTSRQARQMARRLAATRTATAVAVPIAA
jgi:4-diphosphocytidyl-2-C-methyl-D-erythritol kinase